MTIIQDHTPAHTALYKLVIYKKQACHSFNLLIKGYCSITFTESVISNACSNQSSHLLGKLHTVSLLTYLFQLLIGSEEERPLAHLCLPTPCTLTPLEPDVNSCLLAAWAVQISLAVALFLFSMAYMQFGIGCYSC